MKIRQFRCPINVCNKVSSFDLLEVSRANANFLVCEGCGRRWDMTILPSCCTVNIKFICQQPGKSPITVVRSYSK
jgi:transcription elongation factor Elf1